MPEALLVCMAAGLIAGIGTGFAGLSAATVISPMLISFLGCPWYEAVGIGLASDVLASAVSAYIYKKHSNLDFKNGIYMIAAVLIMTIAGSYFSQYMPDRQMGYFSVFTTCFLGLRSSSPQHPAWGHGPPEFLLPGACSQLSFQCWPLPYSHIRNKCGPHTSLLLPYVHPTVILQGNQLHTEGSCPKRQ